jgi:FKBP-type peptidyl-prolyl cis-trans isomerase (trigger factor)
MISSDSITFLIDNYQKNVCYLSICVDKSPVNSLYEYLLQFYQNKARVVGFSPGITPISYLEYSFRPTILEHLKEILFNHCVIPRLYKGIIENSLIIVGEPLLHEVEINPPHDNARFIFECIIVTPQAQEDWKKLPFKAPQRKNYKDLDRQVELFMKDEEEKIRTYEEKGITLHDMVYFDVSLVDEHHKPLVGDYAHALWLRISDEEIDEDVRSLFLHKKIGETFYTDQPFFHDYITAHHQLPYLFKITVKDYLSHSFFSLDYFKHHFKIKVPKDIHHKLIEVFSYRHDISQRRETVEASLKLLLNTHLVSLPEDLIKRQIDVVLDEVRENPDYHVYKAQGDFKAKIRMLAEKQLKERALMDYIAAQEKVSVEHEDILSYLNFMKRPRTKEFVYFNVPFTKIKEKETPISLEVLRQLCLREKALNHVLTHLIKR